MAADYMEKYEKASKIEQLEMEKKLPRQSQKKIEVKFTEQNVKP